MILKLEKNNQQIYATTQNTDKKSKALKQDIMTNLEVRFNTVEQRTNSKIESCKLSYSDEITSNINSLNDTFNSQSVTINKQISNTKDDIEAARTGLVELKKVQS